MQGRFRIVLFVAVLLTGHSLVVHAGQQAKCFFLNSLHSTGEGMRYWYEAKDGFMAITGIPYDKLGCKHCHASGCDDCHAKKTDDGFAYSLEMAKRSETCLKCHAREKATFKEDQDRGTLGVHIEADMTCSDCHTAREAHGDGNFYHSMRDPKAMDASCAACHTKETRDYPKVPDSRSHKVHKNKVHCNACHVRNTMTCYNCHFGEFFKTKSKPKSFVGKVKDWLLLVKYQGAVTSGTIQTLVGAKDEPFVVYAPFFTHSVMKKGRECEQCHATEAVKTLAAGKAFTPATYHDSQLDFYKGVIPLAPELLNWPYLKKIKGKWEPFEPKQKPLVQLGLYAEPLTHDDLKKMERKQKYHQ